MISAFDQDSKFFLMMRNNCLTPLKEYIEEAKSENGFPADLMILLLGKLSSEC